jgi:hypothetical protein
MGFFSHKKKESLSELQGVPDGTFRCDVCKFVLPQICLCGAVADATDNPPKAYTLCGVCAIWLGFGEFRFPQGLYFNFTEEQREKIRAFHKELDIFKKEIDGIVLKANPSDEYLEEIHDFLAQVPNFRELILLRFSLLPQNILDLSGRLTRGEEVDLPEIKKANKG